MRTKWYMLGCLTSIILVILVVVFSISAAMKMAKQSNVKVAPNSALVIKLTGFIPEYVTIEQSNFKFYPLSMHDIIQKINSAKTDPMIKSIVLEPNFFSAGYASTHELTLALENFKKSGKKVYTYMNMGGQKDYQVASVSNEIYLNPSASGGIMLMGVGSSLTFYKDLLDKFGVEFKIIKAGKYKAAGETMSRNSMSPEFRESLMSLFGDIYQHLITDLSKNRNISEDSVRYLFEKRDNFFISQKDALDSKLITGMCYPEEFYNKIGVSDDQKISVSKYKAIVKNNLPFKIAVIYANGEITSAKANFGQMNINSKEFNKLLDVVQKDNSIKSVVIRVNSPGGSALESDIINSKILALKKVKPVVISMGDVAASGGYYISSNANYIFADPYTITGSIGVIAMLPDLTKLGKKAGLKSETVGFGKYISINDTWNGMKPEIVSSIQTSIDKTYLEFKSKVAEGRKLSMDDVEEIAQGRVWSADDALSVKLIDEIGTLDQAVTKAAKIVNLDKYDTIYYPEKKNLMNALFDEQFDLGSYTKIILGKLDIKYQFIDPKSLFENVYKDPVQMRTPVVIETN